MMSTMDDVKQRYIPDWMILGDNSRKILLDWFLLGKTLSIGENSMIWIRPGTRLSIIQQETYWVIETPVLLPRMTLCFPSPEGFEINTAMSKKMKYAVIEEFPFRKQSSMDLIQRLYEDGGDVLVVLMNLPRHQGSTDLIAPGEDLEQAVHAYRKENKDVFTMQGVNDLYSILHWHQPLHIAWTNKARRYLADFCERISEVPYDFLGIEEDWRDEGGMLQEQILDALFSYQTTKREKSKNLWDRYASVSRNAIFPTTGYGPLDSVMRLYRECLHNPLVLWSVAEDEKDFIASLQVSFGKALDEEEQKGHYRNTTLLPTRLDENSYLRLAARCGDSGTALNAIFSQKITEFLCSDVKNTLQKRLQKRYQQLEELIL